MKSTGLFGDEVDMFKHPAHREFFRKRFISREGHRAEICLDPKNHPHELGVRYPDWFDDGDMHWVDRLDHGWARGLGSVEEFRSIAGDVIERITLPGDTVVRHHMVDGDSWWDVLPAHAIARPKKIKGEK
jgi:hypothetical protein